MPAKVAQKTFQQKRSVESKKPVARKRVQTVQSSTGDFIRENARLLITIVSAIAMGIALFVGYQAVTASAVFQS